MTEKKWINLSDGWKYVKKGSIIKNVNGITYEVVSKTGTEIKYTPASVIPSSKYSDIKNLRKRHLIYRIPRHERNMTDGFSIEVEVPISDIDSLMKKMGYANEIKSFKVLIKNIEKE